MSIYLYFIETENHGSIALVWANSLLGNSTRSNNSDTTKVILFASKGQFDDKTYIRKMFNVPIPDAAAYNANSIKNSGEHWNLYVFM